MKRKSEPNEEFFWNHLVRLEEILFEFVPSFWAMFLLNGTKPKKRN